MTYRPLDVQCQRCLQRPAEQGMTLPGPHGRRIHVCWLCLQQHLAEQRPPLLDGPTGG